MSGSERRVEKRPGAEGYCDRGKMVGADGSLELRRKRLLFRAWHRGIRETDLILGRFADAHVATLDADEIADFERLLDIPDRDILAWVTGADAIPEELASTMIDRVLAFHNATR